MDEVFTAFSLLIHACIPPTAVEISKVASSFFRFQFSFSLLLNINLSLKKFQGKSALGYLNHFFCQQNFILEGVCLKFEVKLQGKKCCRIFELLFFQHNFILQGVCLKTWS